MPGCAPKPELQHPSTTVIASSAEQSLERRRQELDRREADLGKREANLRMRELDVREMTLDLREEKLNWREGLLRRRLAALEPEDLSPAETVDLSPVGVSKSAASFLSKMMGRETSPTARAYELTA